MKKQRDRIVFMAEMALLIALILLMSFTPIGYLQTPWGLQITFIVVPVAIGAVVLGPGAGAALGLVFAIFVSIWIGQNAMANGMQHSKQGWSLPTWR